ncbi:hypothetical protein F5148DRAFT_1356256 [Russula earlei]|uniref:Uncharacterized protein n=1 Tax=Russula earlei TaxID=71964 RepID=A0ACC0U9V0_9AGAM|nr:hypothetical protein F5148DRAFT_1356256 [Russula earlei]
MFGILNPPNAFGQPSSAGMMMPNLTTENPSTQAAWSYMTNATAGQPAAAAWGDSMDLSNMPGWAQSYAAENIFRLVSPKQQPIMMPTDVAATVRANNADNSTSTSAAPSTSTTSASGKNGAGALSSPRVAVGLVAVAAALFAL